MCGIVGIVSFNSEKIDERTFHLFRDSLYHRGPDGYGTYLNNEKNVALGHRRLSILDTSLAGSQPMSYANERYWIVFNGEIYNFIEIRKELRDFGYNFKSESDTEVILASYDKWGEECQNKFNGMWAFAIWDNKKKEIFMSRDRFGVKPLYYLYDKKFLIFASELKAFMCLPDKLVPEFNFKNLASLGKDNHNNQTILNKVFSLNSGSHIKTNFFGKFNISKWWETSDHIQNITLSYNDQIDYFKELFTDSCLIRMRSDVPICSSLSGGIDSSSVVSMMSKIRSGEVKDERYNNNNQAVFICDFIGTEDYNKFSEKKYADQVVNFSEARPYYINYDINSVDQNTIKKATFYQELIGEPAIGPWEIYKSMRENNYLVSLDGHGGDELLAGYHTHIPSAIDDALLINSDEYLKDILNIESELLNLKKNRNISKIKSKAFIKREFKSLYSFIKKFKNLQINKKNKIDIKDFQRNYKNINEHEIKKIENFSNLNNRLYDDFHNGVLTRVLHKFDRLSMAHGVEVRAPLLDFRLVKFLFSLPNTSKIYQGFTKKILRDTMKHLMPEVVRTRKSKMGFDPMSHWYQKSVNDFILDTIHKKSFRESNLWNGKMINKHYQLNKNIISSKKIFRFTQAHELIESFNVVKKTKKI